MSKMWSPYNIRYSSIINEITAAHNAGQSMARIGNTHNLSSPTIRKILLDCGLTPRAQRRESHYNWKGGKTICGDGRYLLRQAANHPRADKSGYVLEHILIAEKMIGRRLKFYGLSDSRSEIVHHKNRNGQDNSQANLEITSVKQHIRLHHSLLNAMQIQEITKQIRAGTPIHQIAAQYVVGRHVIYCLKRRLHLHRPDVCQNGTHRFTKRNTYLFPDGKRLCRSCQKNRRFQKYSGIDPVREDGMKWSEIKS